MGGSPSIHRAARGTRDERGVGTQVPRYTAPSGAALGMIGGAGQKSQRRAADHPEQPRSPPVIAQRRIEGLRVICYSKAHFQLRSYLRTLPSATPVPTSSPSLATPPSHPPQR